MVEEVQQFGHPDNRGTYKIEPHLKRKISLGEIRLTSIYDGDISSLKNSLPAEFPQLECTFFDWNTFRWENLTGDMPNNFTSQERPYKWPLEIFQQNSLYVFYNCEFPEPVESEDKISRARRLCNFVEYFEGGSGDMSFETGNQYRKLNTHILILLRTKKDLQNYVGYYKGGRAFWLDSDNLFEPESKR